MIKKSNSKAPLLFLIVVILQDVPQHQEVFGGNPALRSTINESPHLQKDFFAYLEDAGGYFCDHRFSSVLLAQAEDDFFT